MVKSLLYSISVLPQRWRRGSHQKEDFAVCSLFLPSSILLQYRANISKDSIKALNLGCTSHTHHTDFKTQKVKNNKMSSKICSKPSRMSTQNIGANSMVPTPNEAGMGLSPPPPNLEGPSLIGPPHTGTGFCQPCGLLLIHMTSHMHVQWATYNVGWKSVCLIQK